MQPYGCYSCIIVLQEYTNDDEKQLYMDQRDHLDIHYCAMEKVAHKYKKRKSRKGPLVG